MIGLLESARHDWESGYRRFREQTQDTAQAERLHRQLELVLDGLRRRLGAGFTLAELATAYADADRWIRHELAELGEPGWAATLTTVEDAAFHLYSRSARDYAP